MKKHRLGVLIYVSALETEARILCDHAAHAALAHGRLHEFERRLAAAWACAHGKVGGVCEVLESFLAILFASGAPHPNGAPS